MDVTERKRAAVSRLRREAAGCLGVVVLGLAVVVWVVWMTFGQGGTP